MSPEPTEPRAAESLSEAEQAAAEALARHFNLNYSDGIERHGPVNWGPEARAVVAAVRPILAAEALEAAKDRLLDQADRVLTKFGSNPPRAHNRVYGLNEAASMLRADAAALRTTTPEKEN